jgi:hypothetical protein
MLVQKMQVGQCIPVGIQLGKAEVGPTSGPTWRLFHSMASPSRLPERRRRAALRMPPPAPACGAPDAPVPAYSPHRRAQIASPRSNGAGAAAPRGCRADVRRGKPPKGRKAPQPAKIRPSNALAPTGAPEERLGALRPGLRRQRGSNLVPLARWGGQIGQLAPREVAARLLLADGACCGWEPHPLPWGPHPPASDRWPSAGLHPPAPRTNRPAALQRGRACRAEAAPPPRGRAEPRSGSMSAAEAAEFG